MNEKVKSWLESGSFFKYNDLQIFYTQRGQGPDLLIIHGYPYSSYEWKECIDVLSKDYKVTALDLLGMGFSDKPEDHKYSYEEHCDIINALLASLNINQTQILSHDLGVSVVQELIARDLDGKNNFRIVTSAFSNGSLFTSVYRPRLIQRLLSQTPKFIGKAISKVISKNAVNKSVKSVYGKNTPPSDVLLDELWDVLNYNKGKEISYLIGRLIFQKVYYQNRWISAMQRTNIPMCYICGPSDPNSGKHMADEYLRLLPKSKVLWMRDDIGHWPMIEDQSGFLELYLEWMRIK
jgi:pimeloyl-ACP methyl ester carboxylesterase